MNLKKWYADRGPKFITQRASKLFSRYGISAQRSKTRIEDSMQTLAKFGCAPTFFTPGTVVERYPQFIQGLQKEGAEIAVHSYQHIDLSAIKPAEAVDQLMKALSVFEKFGIENHGFRGPYLGCSKELLDSIPADLFEYSSNQAIWVDGPALDSARNQTLIFDTLRRFYQPAPSSETVSNPSMRTNLLEIPVCVPDDLQLHDGLNLKSPGISQVWIEMLQQTHARGDLFNLIFHPELSSICTESFEILLEQAKLLKPAVWITRLCDINDWWKEKAGFKVDVHPNSEGLTLEFTCSARGTVLAKGFDHTYSDNLWNETYFELQDKTLTLPTNQHPFVGLDYKAPEQIVTFLREQGYIVITDHMATSCEVYIDAETLSRLGSQVNIIDYIETSSAPLIRFWKWPNGAKSAICITGDLDAMTLFDYASRLSTP